MKKLYLLCTMLLSLVLYAQPPAEGGAQFNGSNEDIPVPNSNNINTTNVNNRTVEMYFKVDNASSRQVLFEEGGKTNAVVFYIQNNFIHAGAYKNNGGANNSVFFRKAITNNTWYHVALVLENANTFKFYIDGVLQDSQAGFSIPSHSGGINMARSSSKLRFPNCAMWSTGGTSEYCLSSVTNDFNQPYYFTGHIWGFRMWNDARTDAEILNNKDVLITDVLANPDLLMVLNTNNTSIDYLASNGGYQNAEGNFSTLSLVANTISNISIYAVDKTIYIKGETTKFKTLTLYSVLGQQVLNVPFADSLNISSLQSGVYILKIGDSQHAITKKIIL